MANTIIIPREVDHIGSYSFAGVTDLQSVVIPKTVSYIAKDTFRDCRNLAAIYCEFGTGVILGEPWGAPKTCRVYYNTRYEDKSGEIEPGQSGGGIDTNDATATAGDILYPKTAYSKGKKLTGNVPTITPYMDGNTVIVPAGYNPEKQTFTVEGIDTSGATVTADKMLDGVKAINADGELVTGTIKTVTASLSGNVTTVPAGYIAKKQTLTVPAVTPTLADNVVTVPQGYISSKQTLTVAEMAEPTLSANVVTIGKGYNKAQKTVTVAEAGEISVTDNVVTVPVGYIKSQRTATIPEAAEPSVSGNVVTVNKGYVKAQQTVTIPEMTVSNDGEKVTIPVGYNKTEQQISIKGGGGASGLVKVTEFIAPHDAYSAATSIEVSGFGEAETWDGTTDFSAWNGTYHVTPSTAGATATEKRIYKHATENKYLFRMWCEDNYEYYWVFNTSPSANYVYDGDFYADELASGTWRNYEYEFEVSLALNLNTVDYPKQELVLNVTPAAGYSVVNDVRIWSFGDNISASGYEVKPVVGAMYVLLPDSTLSSMVYVSEKQGVNGLVFIADMTSPTAEIGAFTTSGEVTYSSNGALLASVYLTTSILVEDFSGDFTFMAEITLPNTSRVAIIGGYDSDYMIGIDTNGNTYNMWAGNSGWNILEADSGYSDDEYSGSGRGSIQVTPNVSQKIVFTRTGNKWELYVDGVLSLRRYREGTIETGGYIAINRWGTGGYHSTGMIVKNVRMYKRGLTAEEIASLMQS